MAKAKKRGAIKANGNVITNYVEQRSESENEFYHHFLYDCDLEIGMLVGFATDDSEDTIDEMISHYDDDGTTPLAFEDCIGVCMQRKVLAWNNRNGDDLVDVRLFAPFRTVGTFTVTGDGVAAGDVMVSGALGLPILITTGATTGNTARFIGF